METVRTVVVGIADKQPSVLAFAAREARFAQASLHVVHAAGHSTQDGDFLAGVAVTESMLKAGQVILDDAKKFLEEEIGVDQPVEIELSSADPVESLAGAASDAAMLVLGADDVPWYDRMLRTRISGHLALSAPCPVVIVPEVQYAPAVEGEVVVTLDGDTSAEGPLRFAFEQASARDSVLHVLHAVPPATMAGDVADLRANLAEVLADWRAQYPEVEVLEVVIVGDPKEVVVRATNAAELVVVGRPHGRSMPLALSRPLAWHVVSRGNCPVAVVPSSYRGA